MLELSFHLVKDGEVDRQLPIDVQHRQVMGSVLEGPAEAEWLYDRRLED